MKRIPTLRAAHRLLFVRYFLQYYEISFFKRQSICEFFWRHSSWGLCFDTEKSKIARPCRCPARRVKNSEFAAWGKLLHACHAYCYQLRTMACRCGCTPPRPEHGRDLRRHAAAERPIRCHLYKHTCINHCISPCRQYYNETIMRVLRCPYPLNGMNGRCTTGELRLTKRKCSYPKKQRAATFPLSISLLLAKRLTWFHTKAMFWNTCSATPPPCVVVYTKLIHLAS